MRRRDKFQCKTKIALDARTGIGQLIFWEVAQQWIFFMAGNVADNE